VTRTSEYATLEGHFGEPRLRLYLAEVSDDQHQALELYAWNARLAAAFFVDLGHLEVSLRNALDARMTRRHAARRRSDTWLDDPVGELGRDLSGSGRHKQPYKDISTARGRVRSNKKTVDHGQILSETGFGLWHQLVSKRWTVLWPDLADAFPRAPDRARETVADPLGRLKDLRNRIGHHHRIWSQPCADLHTDLLTLAGYLSADLESWITTRSDVPGLLTESPLPPASATLPTS
jgi:hypothetical protein